MSFYCHCDLLLLLSLSLDILLLVACFQTLCSIVSRNYDTFDNFKESTPFFHPTSLVYYYYYYLFIYLFIYFYSLFRQLSLTSLEVCISMAML